jgi:hypothetical protein
LRFEPISAGPREYDPVKLGFIVDVACLGEDCLTDTSLVGSGKGGARKQS